jgi:hypothetical protein
MKFTKTNARIHRAHWLVVVMFAVAMSWVEAAVVLYLRTLVDRIEPYQPNPLPEFGGLESAELIREGATIIMLVTVGTLAGHSSRSRLGYALLAFGVWDIFYYLFLKALTGWPKSLFDWDILFLLPLPWWGPVWAPVSIAALMILWGTIVTQCEHFGRIVCHSWKVLASTFTGIALALYAFMADALRVAGEGTEAIRNVLPVSFNWLLFFVALLFLGTPIAALAREIWCRRRDQAAKTLWAKPWEPIPRP